VRNGKVADASSVPKHDQSEWIVIPKNHPAIADHETFDAAQQRLSSRCSKNRSCASLPQLDCYVLTGLVHCEKCGSRMVGYAVKGKQYLNCSGHLDKGASFCDRNAVRQDALPISLAYFRKLSGLS
jgi:hypothetical protein